MSNKLLVVVATLGGVLALSGCRTPSKPHATNIVFILADDLGYGDVRALAPSSRIPTPHIDRLAEQGVTFTNAHAAAAVCTPSRYSFLTGRYSWRSDRKKGVAWVWEGPMIQRGTLTIGQMLKAQGYDTACIGKWHLGLDWPTRDGLPATLKNEGTNVDYSQPIRNGPTDRGFDYYFGQEVPSFPPHAFIENDHVAVAPTAWLQPGMGGIPGAMAPGWRYEDLMDRLTEKALDYVRSETLHRPGKPFFLYFAMSAPHTPIAPHESFQGKTPVGRYGDYVTEMDYHVGRLLDLLDELDIARDTLVIFTSDNGGVNEDGSKYESDVGELVKHYGHDSNAPLRGMKSDAWEGGHRVPFMVRWPGHVQPQSRSGALISLVDMMATFAALTGAPLPKDAAEDSFNLLPVFEGKSAGSRETLVTQSGEGVLSIQTEDWKLVTCSGGGGKWNPVGELASLEAGAGGGAWKNVQLYNIRQDIAEHENLASRHQGKVRELMRLLKQYVLSGRSTPGQPLAQKPVKLWPEVQWLERVE